jgi:hypothetical protein
MYWHRLQIKLDYKKKKSLYQLFLGSGSQRKTSLSSVFLTCPRPRIPVSGGSQVTQLSFQLSLYNSGTDRIENIWSIVGCSVVTWTKHVHRAVSLQRLLYCRFFAHLLLGSVSTCLNINTRYFRSRVLVHCWGYVMVGRQWKMNRERSGRSRPHILRYHSCVCGQRLAAISAQLYKRFRLESRTGLRKSSGVSWLFSEP